MTFIEVPFVEEIEDIEEWARIRQSFPPSFFVVWVLVKNKKRKAYLDGPNRQWVLETRNIFETKVIQKVSAWKGIESRSFENQKSETF